jgi:hypothetical protein
MRNSFLLLLVLSFLLLACKKDSSVTDTIPEDNGCIVFKKVLVTDHAGYTINSGNIAIINSLFASNGINASNFRYYYYSNDSTQTFFPPFAKFDNKVVRLWEFNNGLEIFNGTRLFQFKNNVLNYTGGIATHGTALDTLRHLTIGQLRALYMGHAEQFEQKATQYKDSCLDAEFGYYNIYAGTGNSTEQLIKAWKVSMKNNGYPLAYYQDNDGKLLSYDNGIRTFK